MRGVLLGLVLERPGHGGDLANRMLVRLGETWRIDTNVSAHIHVKRYQTAYIRCLYTTFNRYIVYTVARDLEFLL